MTYKKDGTPHKVGTEGEKKVLDFFNNIENSDFISSSLNKIYKGDLPWAPFNFQRKGGTKNRTDIHCLNNKLDISIKSKKIENNKYKGTFDLLNTSKLKDIFDENEKFKEWELKLELIKNKKANYEFAYNIVTDYYNELINNVSGNEISKTFNKIHKLENNIVTVVRDYKVDVDETINKDDLHFLENDWILKEFKNINLSDVISTDKGSSFLKTNNNRNSPFRIRIALNNGIGALLRGLGLSPKLSNSNNSSTLTVKIQVDKVDEIVKKYDVNNKNKN